MSDISWADNNYSAISSTTNKGDLFCGYSFSAARGSAPSVSDKLGVLVYYSNSKKLQSFPS
jgi:hypothetical protein